MVLRPAAKSRFSVCCVLAQPTAKGYKRDDADKIERGEYTFHGFGLVKFD